MQQGPHQQPSPAPVIIEPPRPKPRRRFRWELVLVPLALLLIVYFVRNVDVSLYFEDVMDFMGFPATDRVRRLTILGIVATGIVLVVKALRSRGASES